MKILAIGLVLMLISLALSQRRKMLCSEIAFFNLIQGMTALFGATLSGIGGFLLVAGMK